jgi:hypothetical protein
MTGRYIAYWEFSFAEDKYKVKALPEEEWYKVPISYRASHSIGCHDFIAKDELEVFMTTLKIEEQLNNGH